MTTMINGSDYFDPEWGILHNCNSSETCAGTWSFQGPRCCNWWALLLSIFPLMTFFGNVLVIMAVAIERNLQTQTNFYIVSLAVADLLVAVFVMPFGVYYLLNNMWSLPAKTCDCYIAIDVICSTSSILNLVAISIDRFVAVIHPIRYARHKKEGGVKKTIIAVWVISILIGLPIGLGVNDTPDRPLHECLFNNKDYVIYSSLISFYIPCMVMLYFYSRVIRAIRERARIARETKKKTQIALRNIFIKPPVNKPARKSSIKDDKQTASGSNDDGEFRSSSERTEAGVGAEGSTAPRTTRFMLAAVVEETGKMMTNLAVPKPVPDQTTCLDSGYSPSNLDGDTKDRVSTPPVSAYPTLDEVTVEEETQIEILLAMPPNLSSRRDRMTFREATRLVRVALLKATKPKRHRRRGNSYSARKEKKATQTLAIVIGCFLVCWVPFFTCSVYDAICEKLAAQNCAPGVNVFYVTTWLGYMNSFLNPIIYTIFNLEFRRAFRKILKFD